MKIILKGHNEIYRDTHILGTGGITFDHVSICGLFCVFGCNEYIEIGENVLIADGVSIRDTDHVFKDRNAPILSQGVVIEPVVIKDDVWIGHGVIILKGVRMGKGAVVVAGAVVTKDVEPFVVVGGIPVRVISQRGL